MPRPSWPSVRPSCPAPPLPQRLRPGLTAPACRSSTLVPKHRQPRRPPCRPLPACLRAARTRTARCSGRAAPRRRSALRAPMDGRTSILGGLLGGNFEVQGEVVVVVVMCGGGVGGGGVGVGAGGGPTSPAEFARLALRQPLSSRPPARLQVGAGRQRPGRAAQPVLLPPPAGRLSIPFSGKWAMDQPRLLAGNAAIAPGRGLAHRNKAVGPVQVSPVVVGFFSFLISFLFFIVGVEAEASLKGGHESARGLGRGGLGWAVACLVRGFRRGL